MELKLISFETAKQLKEIGFNHMKANCYGDNMCYQLPEGELINALRGNTVLGYILAPTLALAQMWFRKEHDIDIHITRGAYSYPLPSNMNRKKKFMTVLYSPLNERGFQLKGVKATYEQALEAGILESIKLIKTKQDD